MRILKVTDSARDQRLRRRIERKIRELETCPHTLCSMADTVAEEAEARSLRQMLCDHKAWRKYDGATNSWVPSKKDQKDPGGCYCVDCDISAGEVDD